MYKLKYVYVGLVVGNLILLALSHLAQPQLDFLKTIFIGTAELVGTIFIPLCAYFLILILKEHAECISKR